MKKLAVVVGGDVSHVGEEWNNYVRVNYGEIATDFMKKRSGSPLARPEVISDYLQGKSEDILIGFGMESSSDYLNIKSLVPACGYSLAAVFIFMDDYINRNNEFKEKYGAMVSYSNDFIQHQIKLFTAEVNKLEGSLKADGVEIIYL